MTARFGKRVVEPELIARTTSLGFRKTKHHVVRKLSDDASLSIGYGTKTWPSGLVTLSVSVHLGFESALRLGVKLGLYYEGRTACLSSMLKYLAPEGVIDGDYEFWPSEDNRATFDRVLHDVTTHAVPYFEHLTTVELALQALEAGRLSAPYNGSEFRPLALYLVGRPSEALAAAHERFAKLDPNRGSGKDYAPFVKALTALTAN